MRAFRLMIIVLGLSAGPAGCGQKGPLTLPDAQRPHRKIGVTRPPATPAPAPAPAPSAATPGADGTATSPPAPPR